MRLRCETVPHLQVSAVDPDGRLRQRQVTDEAEIERPDARMLRDWESSKGTVKASPTACYLTLRHEELAVIQPNSGHLVLGKRCYFQGQLQVRIQESCKGFSTLCMNTNALSWQLLISSYTGSVMHFPLTCFRLSLR